MKTLTVFVVLFTFPFSTSILAQPKKYEAAGNESFIIYKLSHPLHEVEATSGKAVCLIYADAGSRQIKNVLVQVPVTSFDSGNSNRDSHAMEVVDAIALPYAKFESTNIEESGDSVKVSGKLTFHGITKDIQINASATWSSNELIVNGTFDISLTAFKVERPSLLLIPVNDDLKFILKEVFYL